MAIARGFASYIRGKSRVWLMVGLRWRLEHWSPYRHAPFLK
jgi:hypothetical protein